MLLQTEADSQNERLNSYLSFIRNYYVNNFLLELGSLYKETV